MERHPADLSVVAGREGVHRDADAFGVQARLREQPGFYDSDEVWPVIGFHFEEDDAVRSMHEQSQFWPTSVCPPVPVLSGWRPKELHSPRRAEVLGASRLTCAHMISVRQFIASTSTKGERCTVRDALEFRHDVRGRLGGWRPGTSSHVPSLAAR